MPIMFYGDVKYTRNLSQMIDLQFIVIQLLMRKKSKWSAKSKKHLQLQLHLPGELVKRSD
jgi:hypothetical protein